MRFLVIMPTYNEKDTIGKLVPLILGLDNCFSIFIIDDGSPDGTANIVKDLIKQYPNRIFLKERENKQGLASAYILGFKYAIENNFDFISEFDADFSHPYQKLLEFKDILSNNKADVVIGSRYIKGGGAPDWGLGRRLISQMGSWYTRMVTFMPIHDTTAGFIGYKKDVLKTINLDAIRSKGYCFQIEMKFAAWKLGFKIKEIPIIFVDRKEGVSKMSGNIVKEAILNVIKLSWENIRGRYVPRIKK